MLLFQYKSKAHRILIHVMFWLIYVLFFSFMSVNPKNNWFDIFISGLIFVPVDIFATYVTMYWLLPSFLKQKKYLQFSMLTITLAFLTILMNQAIQYYIYIPLFHPDKIGWKIFWQGNYWYYLITTYTVVVFGAGVKLTKMWIQEQQGKNELENEKIKSELLMLKSQINPHFLFNTLNNIDALIGSNPDKASESLIRLSGILRYVTYDSQNEYVSIEKEEDILLSYIGLSELRYGSGFISYESEISNYQRQIAPMLLIPLVENAVKHGDKRMGVNPVRVVLKVAEEIFFSVSNSLPLEEINKDSAGGVGLSNLKRRLELVYPGKHTFTYGATEQSYIAQLWIK